jgi:hypothetical protein
MFQLIKDPFTGDISTKQILYTDPYGTVWTVPLGVGHRFEQTYDDWLAAGNVATLYQRN